MVDTGLRSPLTDLLVHGECDRDVKVLAARGTLAPRVHEQVALLMLLSADGDTTIAAEAEVTLAALPREALAAFLARADVPEAMRGFFAARGVEPAPGTATAGDEPLIDAGEPVAEGDDEADEGREARAGEAEAGRAPLSSLPIVERMKLAFKGTREQRGQLIRDSNRMIAAAVLSSPKLNESEVEAYAKMGNVGEDVLRTIGTNRTWLKNYNIALALTRNPKTPPGISTQLLRRLNDRDIKAVVKDRNVPEALRLAARRLTGKSP